MASGRLRRTPWPSSHIWASREQLRASRSCHTGATSLSAGQPVSKLCRPLNRSSSRLCHVAPGAMCFCGAMRSSPAWPQALSSPPSQAARKYFSAMPRSMLTWPVSELMKMPAFPSLNSSAAATQDSGCLKTQPASNRFTAWVMFARSSPSPVNHFWPAAKQAAPSISSTQANSSASWGDSMTWISRPSSLLSGSSSSSSGSLSRGGGPSCSWAEAATGRTRRASKVVRISDRIAQSMPRADQG